MIILNPKHMLAIIQSRLPKADAPRAPKSPREILIEAGRGAYPRATFSDGNGTPVNAITAAELLDQGIRVQVRVFEWDSVIDEALVGLYAGYSIVYLPDVLVRRPVMVVNETFEDLTQAAKAIQEGANWGCPSGDAGSSRFTMVDL